MASLTAAGEPCTLRGVRSLLERCIDALRHAYISASTPCDFVYPGPSEASPYTVALLDAPLSAEPSPTAAQAHSASVIIDHVLLPLCRAAQIPLLLRMGTRRRVNAGLAVMGDSLGSASLTSLAALCAGHAV